LPTRGTPESAGLDLYAATEQVIQPGAQAQIKTGLALALPKGTYGRIAPQSGLAWKHRIFVNAGVIDSDYRKEVLAILWNNDTTPFHIHTGDRIAQLILEKIEYATPIWTDTLPNPTTEHSGFGSTGIRTVTTESLLEQATELAQKLRITDIPQTLDLLSDWADENHRERITLSTAIKFRQLDDLYLITELLGLKGKFTTIPVRIQKLADLQLRLKGTIRTLDTGEQHSVNILLDSGCTNSTINITVVEKYQLATIPLAKPIGVRNADGTPNTAGMITHVADLRI
jgi:deoxyuridine 5'-triphosphate nucleotidohydrolase